MPAPGHREMLNGIILLWFVLTGLPVLFVGIDIRSTPESPVLKWGAEKSASAVATGPIVALSFLVLAIGLGIAGFLGTLH